ncbi:heme NO-binding domain-containing protein [Endozoicomonas sp. SM1973]|uniref:Heme NO-binding domain-containing protein n=1 Tax=Spartinivicinus marinus TaxID=2994442 RepID=A0A853IB16_9GAMM|nr:heme NO-binding domain-containing protein [Spartinivicinus marinus]MCX4026928.1 heme NO-binding domain-containing protein [Spartinivicinus marinus]NYZ66727.1 heme NO-binding domain-containing protein [Spartinivicinus marinus]
MKGIIFTEFIDMAEKYFSPEMVDILLSETNLPSKGIYTSIGSYDISELLALIDVLSKHSDKTVKELLQFFGFYLFGRLASIYQELLTDITGTFQMLEKLDDHIHVEVKKLYPDADIPKFEVIHIDKKELKIRYQSSRPLADLAEGLIKGCIAHYNEKLELTRHNISEYPPYEALFCINDVNGYGK